MVALDRQFYDVLRAVMSSTSDGPSCTDRARAAVAGVRPSEYLAAMIEEGWLEGSVEREPAGEVRAIFVRTLSTTGRTALIEKLAHSAGEQGLETLGQVTRQRMVGEFQLVDSSELNRLRSVGLLRQDHPIALSDLGELLLSAEARRSMATNMTVIQGVTNSQVAVGSSQIKGDISIAGQPPEWSDLIAVVEELAGRVAELEVGDEIGEEILADLATIRSQLASPKPKRGIIRACAENVQAVLQGTAGNAVYAGFVELLKRLIS